MPTVNLLHSFGIFEMKLQMHIDKHRFFIGVHLRKSRGFLFLNSDFCKKSCEAPPPGMRSQVQPGNENNQSFNSQTNKCLVILF